MVYFKKISFKAEDIAVLQAALERSSEAYISLGNFQSMATAGNAGAFFARTADKSNVNYTRLMSRFGRFAPKMVFNVVSEAEHFFCRLRLSNRSIGVLILIIGGIVTNLILADKNKYGGLVALSIALTVFILFAALECMQTQLKIKRAMSCYKLIERIKLLVISY